MISAILHKTVAFVLVFILFAHNINTLVIIGDFIANQDFIAKTLCIQKENQQGCNGKCHLNKELAKSEPDSKSSKPLQETKRMTLDVFYPSNVIKVEKPSIHVLSKKEKLHLGFSRLTKMYLEVDTPPPNFC
tara:strand:- start:12670 stop:13065 length:396 start_codon:yes stop_codon:yes gene_type:complete